MDESHYSIEKAFQFGDEPEAWCVWQTCCGESLVVAYFLTESEAAAYLATLEEDA